MDNVFPTALPGTQATLLLCASFGQNGDAGARPLTLAELNRLETALAAQKRQLADLLAGGPWIDGLAEAAEPERLRALLGRGALLALAVEQWNAAGLWILSRGHPGYPPRLLQQLGASAPCLLYGVGARELLDRGGLALVGSRDASPDALSFTQGVAQRSAEQGLSVISGGARGIDAAAIRAALEAGGRAVAVLADNLLRAVTVNEYKAAIRDERLTLATPHDPEAHFTVWRAMERNDCLYGLADFAVVVQFTTDKGGTWAGTIEHLKRSERLPQATPVLVRQSGNPQEGLHQLFELGAVPFPEEAWRGSCQELFRLATRKHTAPSLPLPESADFYSTALPLLLDALREPRDRGSLQAFAEQRNLSNKQLDLWLALAVEQGHIKKKRSGKSVRYVAAAQSLFDQIG
jgi:predicted Rossmann fold nucleotide-binding protein DprA/Smf involved in DNA uptake